MKLSQRLFTIASLVRKDSVVADIGADHGMLSIYLIEEKIAKKVFAVENKMGPFSNLENNTRNYPEISVSLSDGISLIPDDIDTVVIAGMGGLLISEIFLSHKEKLQYVNNIIVDAHRDLEVVRLTLQELGFEIVKETLVKEGVFYNVISAQKGHHKLSPIELEFGYKINDDPLFKEYQEHLLTQFENNFKQNNSLELKEKIERLKKL